VNGLLAGKRARLCGTGETASLVAAALTAAGAELTDTFECDALVHCSVARTAVEATAMDLDEWRAALSDDLDDRFLKTTEFARACFAAGRPGSVLMVAPAHGDAAIATGHGALDNLVKSLAVEWARDGVRTNAIVSRKIYLDGGVAPGAKAALGHLVSWLLSDYAVYVSGCVMGLDETGNDQ
jgi:NAD(P)-dependent dehydrogenase (short-subunit alcohol dehydrogenase family)